MADDDLVVAHQLAFLEQHFQPGEPELVIAHGEVFGRVAVLARKAPHVDVPAARHGHGHRQREGAAFPLLVKRRLVGLGHDRAEAVLAAEVLPTVHCKSVGDFGRPVPIIESRVTRSASFSSLQPSVPAGRIGTTR